MQIEYKKSSQNLKARTIKTSLMILLLIALNSSSPGYTATINSIKVDNGKILLNTYDLQKFNISGNETNTITIILPNTTLKDIYSFNNDSITSQLKTNLPIVNSLEVVQYSLEPAEARIIIKASAPITTKITNDEEIGQISISLLSTKNSLNPTIQVTSPTEKTEATGNYEFYGVSNELERIIQDINTIDIKASQEELEEIISKDDNNIWAKYYLSVLLIKSNNLVLAKELNNIILKINPSFFASYYTLGIINDIEGNIDEAIEMYLKANKIFPEYQDSHYRLGLDYLNQEKYDEAKREFNRTISIYPEHNGALQNLGLISLKQGNNEEAKTYFKKALRSDALNNLGNLYIQSNEPKIAIDFFNLALKLDPENAIINYNIAKCYQMTEDNDNAIEFYQKTLELNPEMSNAHYNLGIIYAHQTKNKMAIKEFESYLAINPNSDDADNVKSLITKLEKLSSNE